MRRKTPAVVALAVLLLPSGPLTAADSVFGEELNKSEMAAATKIAIDEAIKTASEKIAGTIIEAESEQTHDKGVWEVEVLTVENKVIEVHVDAETGVVMDVEGYKDKTKSGRLKRPRS